ncbi:MAG: ABC transporter ATP-binding protein, partial [Planctomycetota bacterium]|nr:ABC transporter ATP-binding protein [Planctomycetota bacterium]
GKSTLVKILMSVIAPTQARGNVLGHRVGHKPSLGSIGYLPEHHRFPEYLTGAQVLDFYGAMSGVPKQVRRSRAAELLQLVNMSDWGDKRVRGYSKGMRQRIGIAQALMNNPQLVVLDEPTDGVDPVGRRDIRVMLTKLKERGMTVFLNSHLLSELEMVCDRVAILVKGKVYSQGTIDELTSNRQFYELEIAGADLPAIGRAYASAITAASGRLAADAADGAGYLAGGEAVTVARTILRVATTTATVVQPIIDALRRDGHVIKTVRTVRPTLEDLFMEAVIDPTTGVALTPGAAGVGAGGDSTGGGAA